MTKIYVTATIPYVNARPHIGHALEIVQADVIARHNRKQGNDVRFVCGSDDNALKNVQAAHAAGRPIQEFVIENADKFEQLNELLGVSSSDFFRTSTDPKHVPGVDRLWRAALANGDLYKRAYEGLYCVGCEEFVESAEVCPDHGVEPERISETNWFFRLSRYQDQLLELIEGEKLRIEPEVKRNEVLAFIKSGLHDFSVSRDAKRADGWGVPVPADPSQVIYVWWDALGYYVTSLGFGSGAQQYKDWWQGSDERVQVAGKGVSRFHAIYWPAILLSAGLELPTTVYVHDYLTANGAKISKSLGNPVDPVDIVERYGAAALRWWLLRDVGLIGDTDFSETRLVERWNVDVVGGIGNLVNRVVTLVHKKRDGVVPDGDHARVAQLRSQSADLEKAICNELDKFEFRSALVAIEALIKTCNRLIETTEPWRLNAPEQGPLLDAVLNALIEACGAIAGSLDLFVPEIAGALHAQLQNNGKLPPAKPCFQRLSTTDEAISIAGSLL